VKLDFTESSSAAAFLPMGSEASSSRGSDPPTRASSSNSVSGSQRGREERISNSSAPDPNMDMLNRFLNQAVGGLVSNFARQLTTSMTDPGAYARKLITQAVQDVALTPQQQEVVWRVLECNSNWWEVAVMGKTAEGETLPWNRPVGLNMALLHYYHNQLVSERCYSAVAKTPGTPPPLSKTETLEALRFCRWAVAPYCTRGEALAPTSDEDFLAARAADVAGVDPSVIKEHELGDQSQFHDPLCPRHLIAVDEEHNEVILAVRGTSSSSDMMADLIGDPVPFVGGLAHAGIADSSQRLLQETAGKLKELLRSLDTQRQRYLVLTGHSLGAGVVELLAILLQGGNVGMEAPKVGAPSSSPARQKCKPAYTETITGVNWSIVEDEEFNDVQMKVFLYAPPPVYTSGPECENYPELRQNCETNEKARAAAARAMECSIGFAINYDIIPRTSLHNGYNLLQQARAVDLYVPWRKRDIFRLLTKNTDRAKQKMAAQVSAAICKAANGPPAPPNPYARQHPVASRMYHIWGVVGCTSAGLPDSLPLVDNEDEWIDESPVSASGDRDDNDMSFIQSAEDFVGDSDDDESAEDFVQGTDSGSTGSHSRSTRSVATELMKLSSSMPCLYKKSKHLGQWRARFGFIKDGELLFSKTPEPENATTRFPLTAGCTLITLTGDASPEEWPPTIVSLQCDEETAGSKVFRSSASLRGPIKFTFTIRNEASELLCPAEAASIDLCAPSSDARDAWVRLLVDSIRVARSQAFAMMPAKPPEEWGREALIAHGFVGDHSTLRYEAALECFLLRFDKLEEDESSTSR